ncbi:hypothetical protein ST47_g8552 [Ascochyta rabiei]|uniref:Uncharacterized protein n=1 Tax=Didymella rabiei TaxID=5454 RepID=A0A162Z771_DIDRA|nr:hypothetical protein ST47_g8552 [Ascochyta rabiei]
MTHLSTRITRHFTRGSSASSQESKVAKYRISRPIMVEREDEDVFPLIPARELVSVTVPGRGSAPDAAAGPPRPTQCAPASAAGGESDGGRGRDAEQVVGGSTEWDRDWDGRRCSDDDCVDIEGIMDLYLSIGSSPSPSPSLSASQSASLSASQSPYPYPYQHTPRDANSQFTHIRVDMGSTASTCTVGSAPSTTSISARVQRFDDMPPPAPSYAKLTFGAEACGVGSRGFEARSVRRVVGGARGYQGL